MATSRVNKTRKNLMPGDDHLRSKLDEVIVQSNENKDAIEGNDTDVESIEADILTNAGNITTNAGNIATNTSDIAANLDGISEIIDGTTTFTGLPKSEIHVGTPGTGVTAVEYGNGIIHVSVLTLSSFIVGTLAGAGVDLAIGNPIYELPSSAVHIMFSKSFSELTLTATGTAVATDTGLGSVVGSGANATLDAVGATSENYLTGQTMSTGSPTGATAFNGDAIDSNGASDEKTIFLNSAGTWNADNTGNLTADGIIILVWMTAYDLSFIS